MSTATTSDTVVGVFDDPRQAQQAVNELRRQGYTDDQIGVVSQRGEGESATETGTGAEEGAAIGAATGAGIGALWGLGILAGVLPGIGPAIAGGTLGILLSSAAAGAATAGIAGALIGLGISDEDASYYEDEFRAGKTIVTVRGGPNAAAVHSVFNQFGGYDRASSRSATRPNVPR
jgi:hypothetical protein